MDNYDLWEAHDREEAKWLETLPVCSCCGDPIQDEYLFDINGDIYCEDCLISEFRQDAERYYDRMEV